MKGLLLIDKPKEWTSFDVVAKIRGILNKYYKDNPEHYACEQCEEAAKRATMATDNVAGVSTGADDKAMTREMILRRQIYSAPKNHRHKLRVGHSGTLDPLATGLLILAIGKATKQLQHLTKLDKTYEAELTLGATSTTDDAEGEINQTEAANLPDLEEVSKVIESFTGPIEQTPPAFSAIKIDGKRAYKLAREGKEVKIEPRKVEIFSIDDIDYNFPVLRFTVKVSSGTYIRSLARDIGEQLGIGAYLSNLRRTEVGNFSVQDAVAIKDLSNQSIRDSLKTID